MNIETNRLVIRKLQQDDLEASFAHRSDPDVCRYVSKPITRQQAQSRIDMFSKPWKKQENEKNVLAIELKSAGQLVGEVMIKYSNVESQIAEIGYRLASRYQGQGYAFEAASALLDYGFSQLNLHKITALCVAENTASWRLMEKLGMKKEGELASHFKIGDAWKDGLIYAKINPAHQMAASQPREVKSAEFLKEVV